MGFKFPFFWGGGVFFGGIGKGMTRIDSDSFFLALKFLDAMIKKNGVLEKKCVGPISSLQIQTQF